INPTRNSIRMEIDQSDNPPLTASLAPKTLQHSTLKLATRKIKTNIVVNNGDTAVLGGLVRDREVVNETKVPFLGDLPVIGWLFKSKNRSNEKVNLMVFLTPKIIRTQADSRRVLDEKLEERTEFLKKQGGVDPFGYKIDKMTRTNSVIDDNSNNPRAEAPAAAPQQQTETEKEVE
ncbi:MAG: type II secretion system protein GspD, partial [Pseudobdellovibrionaceae bacterium]